MAGVKSSSYDVTDDRDGGGGEKEREGVLKVSDWCRDRVLCIFTHVLIFPVELVRPRKKKMEIEKEDGEETPVPKEEMDLPCCPFSLDYDLDNVVISDELLKTQYIFSPRSMFYRFQGGGLEFRVKMSRLSSCCWAYL